MQWTHYNNLRVSKDASFEEIRQSYRKLISLHHPNRAQAHERAEKNRICKIINHSYKILSDPRTRALYDEKLQQQEDLFANIKNVDDYAHTHSWHTSPHYGHHTSKYNSEETYEILRNIREKAMPFIKDFIIFFFSTIIILILAVISLIRRGF